MEHILTIAKNVDIIAMGEATHGQSLITKIRIDIFKELVKKCGYTVFVLEENYSCCELINNYIKKNKGNIDTLLHNVIFPWKHKYMLDLIKWMRQYNVKNNNVLEFKGVDTQYICKKYKSKSKINKFVNTLVNNNKISRDVKMFKVFMKFYNPKKKYFLYAHNAHIQKNDNIKKENNIWFGNFLYNKFKKKYYTIGNTFYYGSYIGIDEDNKFKIIKITKKITDKSKKIKNGYNETFDKNSIIFEGSGDVPKNIKDIPKYFYKTNNKNNRFDSIWVTNGEIPLEIMYVDDY